MTQTKSEWRRALLRARSAVPRDVHRRDSGIIAERVGGMSCLAAVRSVLAYRALGAEVDVSHVLALPGVRDLPRFAPVFRDGAEPRWAIWSDASPNEGDGELVSAADLVYPVVVLVPGVGFDDRGVRLGRGAGFYDRALADLRAHGTIEAVGVAFECQVVPTLPSDQWDQRVDYVATERRIVACSDVVADRGEARP